MALYTKVFSDFLDENELGVDWQSIVTRFGQLPNFNINNVNISAYDMFKRRYLEREIGSETSQKFIRFINMQLDVSLIEYSPRINAFINNYTDLFNKTITESKDGTEKTDDDDTHTGSYSDSGTSDEKDFLNPVTTDSNKLKDRTTITSGNTRTFNQEKHVINHDITYDIEITKELEMSNAKFIEEIQNLKNYYIEFIDSFDSCFMGIY